MQIFAYNANFRLFVEAEKVKFLSFAFRRLLARDQRVESLSEVRADWRANEYQPVFWLEHPHTQIRARITNPRVYKLNNFANKARWNYAAL